MKLYFQVYQGSESKCTVENLEPNTQYLLRVAAVRHCEDSDFVGNLSPPTAFSTPVQDIAPQALVTAPQTVSYNERRTMNDRHLSFFLVLAFELLCFLIAMFLEHFFNLNPQA